VTAGTFRLKEQRVPNPRRSKNGWQLEELKEGSWNTESRGEVA